MASWTVCKTFASCCGYAPRRARGWRGPAPNSKLVLACLQASTSFPEFGYSTNNMGKARAAKVRTAGEWAPCRGVGGFTKILAFRPLAQGENMFYVRDLLEMANTTFKDIAAEGGIIVVTVDWDCDLDRETVWGKDPCTHTFSARRLDRKSAIVRGYSFRNANYYYQNETVLTRDLERRAGIQFIFAVYSVAGACGSGAHARVPSRGRERGSRSWAGGLTHVRPPHGCGGEGVQAGSTWRPSPSTSARRWVC